MSIEIEYVRGVQKVIHPTGVISVYTEADIIAGLDFITARITELIEVGKEQERVKQNIINSRN